MTASTTDITITGRPRREPRPAPDLRPFHRRVGGAALIAAPAALLASEVLYRGTSAPAQLVADAGAHAGAIVASNVLLLLSSALLVPAAFIVLHLARDRGRRLAAVGTALAVLGALGHAAYVGFSSVVLSTPAGDRVQMTALLDRVNHSAALAPVAICILAFALCGPFLAFGAWRAGLVGMAAPLATLAAVAVEIVGGDGMAAGVVKESLAVLALGAIGLRVLRATDDAWSAPSARR